LLADGETIVKLPKGLKIDVDRDHDQKSRTKLEFPLGNEDASELDL